MARSRSCCNPKSRDQLIQIQIETICSLVGPQLSPIPVMGVIYRTAVASQVWWQSVIAEGHSQIVACLRREQCPEMICFN